MARNSRRSVLKRGGAAITGGLGLAGCLGSDDGDDGNGGNGNDDDGDGNGGNGDDRNGDNGNGTGDGDASDVTIQVWHGMGGGLGEAFETMAEDFEGEATLEIDYQGSYRDVLNNTLSSLETGSTPDVVQIARYETKQVLDTGAFRPVEEVLPEDYPIDDLLPALTNYFTIDGTQYSMPFNNSNAILYYNKTAFEEAGLDPESPPDTLEEVREYSEALVESGATEYGFGWPNHMWFIEHWYALAGELLFDNENGREGDPTTIHIDEDLGVEIHEWWRGMQEDDLFVNPGMEAWGEATELFTGQQAGMIMNTTGAVGGIVEAADDEGFEAGTHFHPTVTGDRVGTPIGGGSFWVHEDVTGDHADAVGEFIAHMTSPEQQVYWHRESGYYPVRQDAVDQLEEEGWFEENPAYRTAFDQLMDTEPTAATAGAMLGPSQEVRTTVQEASLDVVTGEEEVEEGLAEAREAAEGVLGNYADAS